jgi:hypothetical protein
MAKAQAVQVLPQEQAVRDQEHDYEENRKNALKLFEQQDNVDAQVVDPDGGTSSIYPEPTTAAPHFDNPLNPRGISSNLTDGLPDTQATGAQKIQDPVPKRPPVAANLFPPVTVQERVSAGQNRKPPQEIVPVIFWLLLVPALIEPLL